MTLDIILRTCDRANVHIDWRTRYCNLPKSDLIKGCVNSLIRSCLDNKDVNLIILDDHSSDQTLDFLNNIKSINTTIIPMTEYGYNYSAHQQFLYCKNSQADLVYSIEDDYLHYPTAINEMVNSFNLFEIKLEGNPIVLYPFDAPEEYEPPKYQCYVVHGSHRHWRTGIFTTNVLMTRPKLINDHWELFETLALKYNGDYTKPRTEHYEESNTIWNIWNRGDAIRFNPIPSLALHLQFDKQIEPFINWQDWWELYASDL
jgi:glycosyltransferase involved in cell wall biosynthesis